MSLSAKRSFQQISFILWPLIILLCVQPVMAGSGSVRKAFPLSGKELARQVYDRENGDDALIRSTMVLIDKNGRKRIREHTVSVKDYGPLIKTVIRFHSPADIEGTGFLSIEKDGGDAKQFLYLPALRRTRRIVSSQKARSFVNSDFTYEDMVRRLVECSEHQIVDEEKIGQIDCWVLETKPKKDADSQYSLIKSWIAKEIDVPILTEYYGTKGNLIKKYRVNRLEKIQNIWTETEVVMEDLRKEHQTILKTRKIVYNTNLKDDIFTIQNLENW